VVLKTISGVTTNMSQKLKKAFQRVKQDMRRLQNQDALREEIEEFREREDKLYQVQQEAERIADMQQDLDDFQ